MISKQKKISVTLVAVLIAVLAFVVWKWMDSQNILWRIVNTSCVPATKTGGTGRCVEVSLNNGIESGHVVFKDRNGALQYLLMPTKKVEGVEDPVLLSPSSPNYWALGWHAKRWMEFSYGATIPREAVSITINSFWGRSQDQLHLHVSCVREDLRTFLRSLPETTSNDWVPVPGGWQGHPYEVRRVIADTLDDYDLFKEVAKDRPENMAHQGIAAIGEKFNGASGFWILRTQLEIKSLWLASIEGDVQDHSCSVLKNPN